jgi:hypothetical protein
MTPYERFINRRYVKIFNHFLKEVVEPAVYDKNHKKIKFKLYGISVRPKSSVYETIPKEELLDSQATVSFFIDSEPSNRLENINFIEDLIFLKGRSFLQLQDGDWLGYKSEKFRLGLNFNKRPLYPLDYAAEDSLTEEVLKHSRVVEVVDIKGELDLYNNSSKLIKKVQLFKWPSSLIRL